MPIPPDSRGERAEPRLNAALDPETQVAWSSPERPELSTPARRRNPILWLLLLMLLVAGTAGYYLWRQNASQPAAPPPPVKASAPAAAPPAIRYPIEDAQRAADAAAKPLPALMVSDTTMQNTLAELFGPA